MNRKWWHDKVAYQIYPKSFYDTNGDGIGDLRGIINKLDYLKDLGIDIIWLSPIFCSPLADQGYDISDYYNIDPRFGTLEEVDELIAEAKKRDMHILLDLVVNHCSDEHEWFKKACEDPYGKYGKYFYIEKIKEDGGVPTNWRGYFGGSVWDKLPGHDDLVYLHLFHKKQPDLNWENEEVREEVYKMVNWWLDRGLGGFRIDAIINIKKALPLHDYPADRPDRMASTRQMLAEAEGVGTFLSELRDRTFKPHDSFAVGEVFDVSAENVKDFISDDGYFSSMFDFSTTIVGASEKGWFDRRKITPEEYVSTITNSQNNVRGIGFLSSIIENHDEPRGVSNYLPAEGCNLMGKKMLAALCLMVRGIPFIYQGQEIGMENCEFNSIDEIDDISTIDAYEGCLEAGYSEAEALKIVSKYSRDNARTPMQWDDSENAGFTTGTPWLKVNPKYTEINVAKDSANEDGLRNFYKELIKLRKSPEYKETIVYGDFVSMNPENDKRLMVFKRTSEEKEVLVVANFDTVSKTYTLDCNVNKVILSNAKEVELSGNELKLEPFEVVILELA